MQCLSRSTTTTSRPFTNVNKPAAARAKACFKAIAVRAEQQEQAAATTRRQLLASVAVISSAGVIGLSAPQHATAAAAAPAACELTASPSGLQYCDLTVGEGAEPAKGSLIRCHYTGRLASNGRVFDSSYERGRPLTFKVGVHEVISGWDLGILGTDGVAPMKEGGKRLLLIPSDLAYGSRGAGGVIPPNAVLEFEVELLGKRR